MKKKNKIKNLIEKTPLIISIILILISIVWFMVETKERQENFYENATILAVLNGKEDVKVKYNYGFNEIESFVDVPFFVTPRVDKEIPVAFNKENMTMVSYDSDTRLPAVVVCAIGVIFLVYYIIKEQDKEQRRKVTNIESARIYTEMNKGL